jgi:hypothetical protein
MARVGLREAEVSETVVWLCIIVWLLVTIDDECAWCFVRPDRAASLDVFLDVLFKIAFGCGPTVPLEVSFSSLVTSVELLPLFVITLKEGCHIK